MTNHNICSMPERLTLGVIKRSDTIAAVVVGSRGVIDVLRTRWVGPSCLASTTRLIHQLAANYGLTEAIIEPDSPVAAALTHSHLSVKKRHLASVASRLVKRHGARQAELLDSVLTRLPQLSGHVSRSAVRLQNRRTLAIAFAAALALSGHVSSAL